MTEAQVERFEQAAAGDREAFWSLVSPFRGLIYSVAFGMLKDPERAEDLLHEVMVKAYSGLPNLRDPAKLSSWLYSMTRFQCNELIRKEQRRRRVMNESGPTMTRVVPVDDWREKENWLTRMEEALAELPEPFRVILGMKYTSGLSCRDIGEALGISVAAVKSRLFEARKLLRKKTQAALRAEEGERDGMS